MKHKNQRAIDVIAKGTLFQTKNEPESVSLFLALPLFMLMRGILRGNENQSLAKPLEQDQATAVLNSLSLQHLKVAEPKPLQVRGYKNLRRPKALA